MGLTPFHIAFPVNDLESTRRFYSQVLGCEEGRSSENWIDFNLFGHQIVAHLRPAGAVGGQASGSHVDGHHVPIPHFGIVLEMATFNAFAERLKTAGVTFELEPQIRFQGQAGEQATMFFLDPSGNALEFKAFADMNQVFAK